MFAVCPANLCIPVTAAYYDIAPVYMSLVWLVSMLNTSHCTRVCNAVQSLLRLRHECISALPGCRRTLMRLGGNCGCRHMTRQAVRRWGGRPRKEWLAARAPSAALQLAQARSSTAQPLTRCVCKDRDWEALSLPLVDWSTRSRSAHCVFQQSVIYVPVCDAVTKQGS